MKVHVTRSLFMLEVSIEINLSFILF